MHRLSLHAQGRCDLSRLIFTLSKNGRYLARPMRRSVGATYLKDLTAAWLAQHRGDTESGHCYRLQFENRVSSLGRGTAALQRILMDSLRAVFLLPRLYRVEHRSFDLVDLVLSNANVVIRSWVTRCPLQLTLDKQ